MSELGRRQKGKQRSVLGGGGPLSFSAMSPVAAWSIRWRPDPALLSQPSSASTSQSHRVAEKLL